VEVDPIHWADLPSPRVPKPGPAPGQHVVTEQGIAPGFLGDATAWTLFGMIFDSVMPAKAATRTLPDDDRGRSRS
jgi:hypothetical protein